MDVSDASVLEKMDLFMPKDKLVMDFDIRMTLAPNPEEYDSLFDRVTAVNDKIPQNKVYATYAKDIIRSEAREILSQYSIAEIASSLEAVNSILSDKLTKSIQERTPYLVRQIGLAGVKYPDIITEAQENAAERREQIQQEEAQLEISKVQLERQLQEQKMKRKIEVEKAQAEAEVNKILANSVTDAYVKYHSLQVMYAMANSDNKMVVPASMLDTVAGQVAIGNQVK
jgi:regulator of protease activity HflC (stomatin/prohibitin superfamily)